MQWSLAGAASSAPIAEQQNNKVKRMGGLKFMIFVAAQFIGQAVDKVTG